MGNRDLLFRAHLMASRAVIVMPGSPAKHEAGAEAEDEDAARM